MDIKPIGGKLWRTGAGHDDIQAIEDLKGALEAMLFVADEPLTPHRLAEVLESEEGQVLSALQELRDEFEEYDRGMQLREVGGGWRMHTHPAYATYIEKLLLSSRRARLTRAAVETLAIADQSDPEHAAHARVRIQTRQWLAERWNQKTYGLQKAQQININVQDLRMNALRHVEVVEDISTEVTPKLST